MKPAGITWLCTLRIFFATAIILASPNENARETTIVSHIPRAEVASSAITAIGYSLKLRVLEIEFVNGAVYRYLEVPPKLYRRLMAAESRARFYDHNIRRHYRSVHVRPRKKQ